MSSSNAEIITKREKQILYAIVELTVHHGYPPSYRDISDTVGLKSSSTISGYIKRLTTKGCLVQKPGAPRTILVTQKGHEAIKNLTEMPKVNPRDEWEKSMFRQKVMRNRVGGERGVT